MAHLDGTASSDPDGSIASYAWTYQGGGTDTGPTPSHTFAAGGTYDVTLVVTDNQGATGTVTNQVTVTDPPPPANIVPTAAFTSSHTDLAASFNGTTSSDPDGTVTNWAWNFGDTLTGTGATAAHTYANPGTYTVTLVVTDNQGATGTTTGQVTVTNPVASNYASDSFSRTVANGFGTADIGGAWTVASTASNYAVSGGTGKITAALGATRSAVLAGVSQTSTEVNTKLSIDKAATGGGVYFAVIGRRIDASNDYRVKLRVQAGGVVMAQLVRVVGGTETAIQTIATVPGLTVNANDVLRVRFQVSGTGTTALAAKVWKDGTTEPAAWLLSANDTTAVLQAPGGVGLWHYLSASATNSPVTLSVDDFTAGPLH